MRLTIRFSLAVCAAMALLSTVSAFAQEALQLRRSAALRDGPADTASTLATLPAQSPVTRMATRQGPWIQVKTATGATGWVHMFDVGSANPPSSVANAATGALRGISKFFNRAGGQASAPTASSPTATVGIRGLSSEDIANAQPNLAALAQADSLRSEATQARRFAWDAMLSVRSVEPLPTPEPPNPIKGATP